MIYHADALVLEAVEEELNGAIHMLHVSVEEGDFQVRILVRTESLSEAASEVQHGVSLWFAG